MAFIRKQYAVIGLGRFGTGVCRTFKKLGHEVLGMDRSEEWTRIAHIDEVATHVVRGDSTDAHALEDIGVGNYDGVVVAIGTNMDASVLTVLNLLDLGVKNIVAKAAHHKHGRVLERVGGGLVRVVYPEYQMGERVAQAMGGVGILESIELDTHNSIIEIPIPANLAGKTLREADLRARLGVTVIAILNRQGVNVAPAGDDRLVAGDIIAIIGPNEKLEALNH